MRPNLWLDAARAVRSPEEPTEVVLILGNPSDRPLLTPLPAEGWWHLARLHLTGPDGTMSEIGFPPVNSEAAMNQEPLVIFEGAEIETSFSLDGRAPVRAPGDYLLVGVVETPDGPWEITSAHWYAEGAQTTEVALPSCRGRTEIHATTCWTLFHGDRLTSLMMRSITSNDPSNPDGVQIFTPERLHEPDPGAHDLVAMECSDPEPSPSEQWVAWLSGRKLHAGMPFVLFNTTALELPDSPTRIIPRVLPRPGNGANIFVLGKEGRELWAVSIDGPRLSEQITRENLDDGDFEDPRSRVVMAAPELRARLTLPRECYHGAVAQGVAAAKSITGLVFTVQHHSGIDVLYAVMSDDGSTTPWQRARVDRAVLLPGTDPAITLDEHGVASVAVLFRTKPSGDDPGRLGLARLAFSADGEPLWVGGIGLADLGQLPEEPVTARLELYIDVEMSHPRCDWCVLFPGNVCQVGRGERAPQTLHPHDSIVQPITLLTSLEYSAIAARSSNGMLHFVCF